MPRGVHYTTCLECGEGFTCGDCIEMHCPHCRGKEHLLQAFGWKQQQGTIFPKWIQPGTDMLLFLTKAYETLRQEHPELPESPDIADVYRLKLPNERTP